MASENPLLRPRIAEVGSQLAAARAKNDQLRALPRSPKRDELLLTSDQEVAALKGLLAALVNKLTSE